MTFLLSLFFFSFFFHVSRFLFISHLFRFLFPQISFINLLTFIFESDLFILLSFFLFLFHLFVSLRIHDPPTPFFLLPISNFSLFSSITFDFRFKKKKKNQNLFIFAKLLTVCLSRVVRYSHLLLRNILPPLVLFPPFFFLCSSLGKTFLFSFISLLFLSLFFF